MPCATTPPGEVDRLDALARYEILDTPREPIFDGITRLAAAICDAPIAVVNLVAEGRQWFKSEVGLGVRETPLETSFCAHAILQRELLVVPDLRADARFADNPLVTADAALRFYAGALLETADGHALGTLCILDRRPRDLDAKQRAALAVLADQVMALLEAHRGSLAQRRLVRALDAALSARSRLLATVAHDLRSPLSVVEMSVPILRDPTSAHQTKTLDRIERAAVSMHRLVDDLLDVEHFAAGTVALTLEPLELSSVVEAAVDSFSLAARAGSIELRAERPEGEQRVVADRGRVHQVLANLIGNAIRFTPAGGSITIRIEPLPGYVRVSVDDTGAGLSADERTKVFEPFWRGGNTADKGAGLGLAISRTIVEAHGGTIGVSSEPGEGASFSFTLRRADVSA